MSELETKPQRDLAATLTLLGAALGLAASFTALIYVGGAAVLWLRLNQLDLPAGAVVSYLPREFLVSIGVREILVPLIALILVYEFFFEWLMPRISKMARRGRRPSSPGAGSRPRTVPVVIVLLELLALGVLAWLLVIDAPRSLIFSYAYAAVAVPMVVVVSPWISTNIKGRVLSGLAYAVFAGVLNLPVAVAWANYRWEPQEAVVCAKDVAPKEGILIGVAANAIYLGETFPRKDEDIFEDVFHPRIVAIPSGEYTHFYFGESLFSLNTSEACSA